MENKNGPQEAKKEMVISRTFMLDERSHEFLRKKSYETKKSMSLILREIIDEAILKEEK